MSVKPIELPYTGTVRRGHEFMKGGDRIRIERGEEGLELIVNGNKSLFGDGQEVHGFVGSIDTPTGQKTLILVRSVENQKTTIGAVIDERSSGRITAGEHVIEDDGKDDPPA